MTGSPNSRRLSLVGLLTALAIVLNLAISFPAPFADFLYYEVWEIPIVIALLLLGLAGGTTVAFLNTIVLELVKPGALPIAPFYNFAAIVAMFAGILAAHRAARRGKWGIATLVAVATSLGVVTRTATMTIVNAIILPLPYPVGFGSFGVTAAQVPALLVPIGIFNFTVALYTIPVAYSIQRALAMRYRMSMAYELAQRD